MNSPTLLVRAASTIAPSDVSEQVGVVSDIPKDDRDDLHMEILHDIKPFSEKVRSDSRLWFLVEQVKGIGSSAFWGNDCLAECSNRHGWRLDIIAEPQIYGDEVFGFLVYKMDNQQKVLHIQYIAVAEKHRRRGIGSKLLKSLQTYATRVLTRATVERICCAVVPEAVEFYQRHNFKKGKKILANENESSPHIHGKIEIQIPLQYSMEWKVPLKRRK